MADRQDHQRANFFSWKLGYCIQPSNPYPAEDNDSFYMRSPKSSSKTYPRFLDSKKQKAQAKRAEIELALEKSMSC